ncbi:hypothetical protein PQU92_03060 [Asticcacaulis sp. BYS171W]|uniref:Methylamine utilization protein MauE n=1 Tax=Asticcacaulis aquaticus TaxID=2984212 RepID=A0ABT5HQL3_9CAUL|nr:hypothetical protein [Asticcacaulis aquaticus]MDC7682238.1 hypothetical protein [Asticcacaulis aquaticus]
MKNDRFINYAIWGLIGCGYAFATLFLKTNAEALGWHTIPVKLKSELPFIIVILSIPLLIVAFIKPKRLWFAAPLLVLAAWLTVEHMTKAECGGTNDDICVVAY